MNKGDKALKKVVKAFAAEAISQFNLSNWNWCIDYSKSVGQKHARMAPRLFISRGAARAYNSTHMPAGSIRKVVIILES